MGEFYFIFNLGFNDQTSVNQNSNLNSIVYSKQFLKGPIFICFCCQPLKLLLIVFNNSLPDLLIYCIYLLIYSLITYYHFPLLISHFGMLCYDFFLVLGK